MPTYMVDVTMTDRYAFDEKQRAVKRMVESFGWGLADKWDTGGVRFTRLTRVFEDIPNLAAVWNQLLSEADEMGYDVDYAPMVVAFAARDTRFDLEDALPYRYRKARPRGRGGPRPTS